MTVMYDRACQALPVGNKEGVVCVFIIVCHQISTNCHLPVLRLFRHLTTLYVTSLSWLPCQPTQQQRPRLGVGWVGGGLVWEW